MDKILITGCAGFIGFHISKVLLKQNKKIFGIDNLNNYYDVKLKKERLKILEKNKKFKFYKIDIFNKKILFENFKKEKYSHIIHLAAQAGVRYSIKFPEQYVRTNLVGFFNILEASKKINVKHLIFSSSSSVYGQSNLFPLKENFNTDQPASFYAATKKSNEVMGYSYSSLHRLPLTVLRLFTVYGPFGRPDMSLFDFVKRIINNKKIHLYNKGNHQRDFTYIDDVVHAIQKIVKKPPREKIPFRILNLASGKPINLIYYLNTIEKNLQLKARKKFLELQKGDVIKTHASLKKIRKLLNYKPKTDVKIGIKKYIDWYRNFSK